MTYIAPFVDYAGLHIPTYDDILQDLVEKAKGIFGQDIYLANDSADYQYLSIIALKISDTMKAIQLAYNNRTPVTAVGTGLDYIVKLNGLARKVPSYSTCEVTLTGTPGTIIPNGVVGDVNGYKWDLPASTIIGGGGTVDVTAVCETIGAITALAGNLSTIITPTAGWISVTNADAALPGQPVESDSQLRSRQAVSTQHPSTTMLSGTVAEIAAVEGVTRFKVYENPTNSSNFGDSGVPFQDSPHHSITAVVEGGTDEDIAEAIYYNKGIGCYTDGDVIVSVTDPLYNIPIPIGFYRPDYVPIFVTLDIHPLTGYTTATGEAIQAAVSAYLNSLEIGEGLTISALYGAALSVMENLSNPTFSIQALVAGKVLEAQDTIDIEIGYKEITQGVLENVVLVEV